MRTPTARLRREMAAIRAERAARRAAVSGYARYADDPLGYASDVLKQVWWAKQQEIAVGLVTPPYRVLAKASHGVGKSHLAGGVVNWRYDVYDPGVVLTTAPTERQVKDVLWKEVRRQRRGRGGFPGPKDPRLETTPDHFAHGFTARDATSFQGQHEEHVFIVFDEAVGVEREFWEAAETMLQGERCAFLAIYNPTDTTSYAYIAEQDALATGSAKVVEIPATCHPNIIAELKGEPPPYPSAIRLAWLETRIRKWCERIDPKDAAATDLEWPPGSGAWYRPGPLAQARLLARWPTASDGVWSDSLWASAEQVAALDAKELPEIGCDVARFGDDWTEIHVRCGAVSLHHESHNGWDTAQTAGRLKMLCREYAAKWSAEHRDRNAAPIDPKTIRVKVDDDGVGGGVVDQHDGYAFIPTSAAETANDPEDYPNRRSELWFATADRAKQGRISLARLPADVRGELKAQAMTPRWKMNGSGQRVVEPKDETKKKLSRSPDGMDAVNLAYYSSAGSADVAAWIPTGTGRANWRERNQRR